MTHRKRWLALAGVLLVGGSALSATKPDKKLIDGVQTLHAANEGEVQMGQLGVQMASDPQVKQFSQRMVDDHSKNDQQLGEVAQGMGVPLTGKAYQDTQKSMKKAMSAVHGKTGAAFDKAFMSRMVKDHQADAKEVKTLADHARKEQETELASFLDTTEQMVQQHLSMAKQVESSVKKGGGTAAAGGATGTGAGAASSGGAGTSGKAK